MKVKSATLDTNRCSICVVYQLIYFILIFNFPTFADILNSSNRTTVLQYVNSYIGTSYRNNRSDVHDYGNTMLQVGLPFAHTPWTPQTRINENKCESPYYYFDPKWVGMRRTHWMSGSCVIDYGSAAILPSITLNMNEAIRTYSLNHENEIVSPAFYQITLPETQLSLQATSQNSAGVIKLSSTRNQIEIQEDEYVYILFMGLDTMYNESYIAVTQTNDTVIISSPIHRWYQAKGEYAGYEAHHYFKLSIPAVEVGMIHGFENNTIRSNVYHGRSNLDGLVIAYLKYPRSVMSQPSFLSIATGCSFVSSTKAQSNMVNELLNHHDSNAKPISTGSIFDIDRVINYVEEEWEEQLSRIDVTNPIKSNDSSPLNSQLSDIDQPSLDDDKENLANFPQRDMMVTFYTALWHTLLLPRVASDYDGDYLSFDFHLSPQPRSMPRTVENGRHHVINPEHYKPTMKNLIFKYFNCDHADSCRTKNDVFYRLFNRSGFNRQSNLTTVESTQSIRFYNYYDDFSMWDIYRAQMPLLNLVFATATVGKLKVAPDVEGNGSRIKTEYRPGLVRDILASILMKAKQGKWMPIFPAWNSYTDEMIGDHCGVFLADALWKGLLFIPDEDEEDRNQSSNDEDVDNDALLLIMGWEKMVQNALISPSEYEYLQGKGRRSLKSYSKYGYIPLEDEVLLSAHNMQQVSRTLEYSYDDYVAAQLTRYVLNILESFQSTKPSDEGVESTRWGSLKRIEMIIRDNYQRRMSQSDVVPPIEKVNYNPTSNIQPTKLIPQSEISSLIDQFHFIYSTLLNHSQSYRNVIDRENTQFIRPKFVNGTWGEDEKGFDPKLHYPWITETTVWQYSWSVPHSIEDLIEIYGGEKSFVEKLNQFFDENNYNHGNEPDHHAVFLYAYLSSKYNWKLYSQIQDIIKSNYGPSERDLPGNEDAGQMSAWLVMSCIGLYQICPGCGGFSDYVITIPCFDYTTIQLSALAIPVAVHPTNDETPSSDNVDGIMRSAVSKQPAKRYLKMSKYYKRFSIRPKPIATSIFTKKSGTNRSNAVLELIVHGRNNEHHLDSSKIYYLQQLFINGLAYDCNFIPHQLVAQGGKWEYYVGLQPNFTRGNMGRECLF